MEVQQFLSVTGGDGKTSYAKNSSFQRMVREAAKSVMEEAVFDFCCAGFSDKLSIADLGCASGPGALSAVTDIVDTVEERCRQLGRPAPEFQLFLNDLPGNDFNSVFQSLKAFHGLGKAPDGQRRCFVAGVPGSFYGRLFPSDSIHFFHSSSCLHWLSQAPVKLQHDGVPLNKGNIYIPEERPPFALEAYSTQFQKDFSDFLKFRSEEMVVGGRMVLILFGRKTWDPIDEQVASHWTLLNQVIKDMVQEGHIAEEKVDSFNLPFYVPRAMELEQEIEREGSFSLKCLRVFEVDMIASQDLDDHIKHHNGIPAYKIAESESNTLRAVLESMLASHFGGDVIEDIFSRFTEVLENYVINESKVINMVLSLVRK